jgi:hypothetical protein
MNGIQATENEASSAPRPVDLTKVPPVPLAWVDEHTYAAIRGCSVKVLQKERRLNIGCPFRRINGTTIRYKFGDITAFLESQPGGSHRDSTKTIQRRYEPDPEALERVEEVLYRLLVESPGDRAECNERSPCD